MIAENASWSCFTSPVSPETPAGADPAYDPDFLRLGQVMQQSRALQGQVTDWILVEKEASQILRSRAKDLRAASWLVVAKANVAGWEGAAEGLGGLAAFLDHFWNAAYPRRARARAGFVAWLWDGLARALGERTADSADRALLGEIEALVAQVDSALAGYLGEANPGAAPFRTVVRERIASLPADEAQPEIGLDSASPDEKVSVARIEEGIAARVEEVTAAPIDAPPSTDPSLCESAEVDATDADGTTEDEEEGVVEDDSTLDDDRSLDELIARALAVASRRERFLATLKVTVIAREGAAEDVALALCERLLPEVDSTLEAWEPDVCAKFFEAFIETLDASEADGERLAQRAHLFRRLLALNPPLALRLRASRRGV